MKVVFKTSFLKELKKLKNENLKKAVLATLQEVESADSVYKIKNLKKLTGYDTYYRIRIGDYRLGIKVDGETVYFVVIEHRKDIYKGFP